jgi:hypothetical protein
MTPDNQPKKVVQLTTTQGLLMVGVLFLFFGGIMYWTANRFPRSFSGKLNIVEPGGNVVAMEPFGCTSDELRARMTINLKPTPSPEGFNEENRALIVSEATGKDFTRTPEPAPQLNFAFRQQDRTEIGVTCTIEENTLTVQDYRVVRKNRPDINKHRWNGDLRATCTSEIGKMDFQFKLQNCD